MASRYPIFDLVAIETKLRGRQCYNPFYALCAQLWVQRIPIFFRTMHSGWSSMAQNIPFAMQAMRSRIKLQHRTSVSLYWKGVWPRNNLRHSVKFIFSHIIRSHSWNSFFDTNTRTQCDDVTWLALYIVVRCRPGPGHSLPALVRGQIDPRLRRSKLWRFGTLPATWSSLSIIPKRTQWQSRSPKRSYSRPRVLQRRDHVRKDPHYLLTHARCPMVRNSVGTFRNSCTFVLNDFLSEQPT